MAIDLNALNRKAVRAHLKEISEGQEELDALLKSQRTALDTWEKINVYINEKFPLLHSKLEENIFKEEYYSIDLVL